MPLVIRTAAEAAVEELQAWRASTYCTPLQAMVALSMAGRWAEVSALINGSPVLKGMWELISEIRRDSTLIEAIAASMSPPLSDAELDALFMAASSLSTQDVNDFFAAQMG